MIVLHERPDESFIANDMPEERGKVNVSTRVHPCYVFIDIVLYLKLVKTECKWIHEDHFQKVEGQLYNFPQCFIRLHREECFEMLYSYLEKVPQIRIPKDINTSSKFIVALEPILHGHILKHRYENLQ